MSAGPIVYRWSGDGMEPLRRFRDACGEFVVGQTYTLVQQEERSMASHRFFFASVAEAWANLPPDVAEKFATSEHLRKWALIKAGYYDQRSIVCASKAEAIRVAAFIRPMDEFAVISTNGPVVIVMTAHSQNLKSMDKATFAASKNAVLDVLADMIHVERDELERHAEAVA